MHKLYRIPQRVYATEFVEVFKYGPLWKKHTLNAPVISVLKMIKIMNWLFGCVSDLSLKKTLIPMELYSIQKQWA